MKSLVLVFAAVIGTSAFAADKACFYQDINMSGPLFCGPAGQEVPDLSLSGWSQRISSLAVEGSATVTLFSRPNFTGNQITIPGSNTDLRVLGWNDVAQSLKINRIGGRVCFFRDVNWTGPQYCVTPGRQIPTLVPLGWNDLISSVTVEGDASAYFWADINYGGPLLVIKQSTPALGNWNDKISSLKIAPKSGL